MNLQISLMSHNQLPKVEMTNSEFYIHLEEIGIRKLVNDHYDLLKKSSISHLFPTEYEKFEQAKTNSADFFVQVLGGPQRYNENRGNPMLRKRHQPFTITEEDRVVWLQCYAEVLLKLNMPEILIQSFWNYLNSFSMMMVNSSK